MKLLILEQNLQVTKAQLCLDKQNTLADLILDRYFELSVNDEHNKTTEAEIAKLVNEEVEVISDIDQMTDYTLPEATPVYTPLMVMCADVDELRNMKTTNRFMIDMELNDRKYTVVIKLKQLAIDVALVAPTGMVTIPISHMNGDTMVADLRSTIMQTFCSL